jgi:tetratricopeptide (TPR) repeat protein/predicted Ser/Thr protein kinase
MVGRTVGRYRIVEKLGQGAMGIVYGATDTGIGRRVAIKFAGAGSNLAEARAISALNHPNIAQLYDYGSTPEGQPYLVMEYVDGQNLSELLASRRLTVEESIRIIRCVALALEEAHRSGVIHRDIKPGNIRITSRNEAKVLDFGLATIRPPEDAEAATITRSMQGAIKGTPAYMSPEQARGLTATGLSDLFSLGVVMYECLTGRKAFAGGNALEALAEVIGVDPEPPASPNESLNRITMRLLSKPPEKRYPSARALIEDLDRAQTGRSMSVPVAEDTVTISIKPWLRGAAALLVLLIGGWWAYFHFLRRAPEPTPEARRWFTQGVDAVREGSFHKASLALGRACEIDPVYPMAHARLAEAWIEMDYTERARESVLRATADPGLIARLDHVDALRIEAARRTVLGETQRAVETYQQIAAGAPPAEKAASHFDLGRAYTRINDAKKAAESYRSAVALDPQFAAAWLRLADIYRREKDFARGRESLAKAGQIFQAAANVEGRAETTYLRALAEMSEQDEDAALLSLQDTIESARLTGNVEQQVKALSQISTIHARRGNLPEAEKTASAGVRAAQDAGVELLAVRGLIGLSNVLVAKGGDLGPAESLLRQAIDIALRNRSPLQLARAQASLGQVLTNQERSREAAGQLRAALDYNEKAPSSTLQEVRLLLARAWRRLGELKNAEDLLHRVAREAEASKQQRQLALATEDLAQIELQRGRFRAAATGFAAAAASHRAVKSALGVGMNQVNLAYALWQLGDGAGFRAALAAAEATARQINSDTTVNNSILRFKADLAAAQGDASTLRTQAAALRKLSDPRRTSDLRLLDAYASPGACTMEENPAAKLESPAAVLELDLYCARFLPAARRAQALAHAVEAFEIAQRFDNPEAAWRAAALAARADPASTDWREKARSLHSQFLETLKKEDEALYISRKDRVSLP